MNEGRVGRLQCRRVDWRSRPCGETMWDSECHDTRLEFYAKHQRKELFFQHMIFTMRIMFFSE